MKVHIRYYAKYVDYTGTKTEDIDVDRMTIAELLELIKKKHPRLKEDKSSLVAVNSKFENERKVISDGDTVSVFPPVSGG
jgi:molybdopterin synthase sulfur carrier subunit